MELFQLFYVSTATASFNPSEIERILEKAHFNNPSQNISGIMMFRTGTFLQLIEGTEDAVRSLYQKISQDPRHRNLFVLMERHTTERMYQDWSMAYQELGDIDLKLIDGILNWKRLLRGEQIEELNILRFLNLFQHKKFS